MSEGKSKFLQFLTTLDIEPNMLDVTVDGPKAGDTDQFAFINVDITLSKEAMDKLVASGLIKEAHKDQWGINYKVVEE